MSALYKPPQKKVLVLNVKSEAEFPSLGPAPQAVAKKTVLNYGAAAAKEPAPAPAPASAPAPVKVEAKHKRYIVTHCYDDTPEDYDGPDEFDAGESEIDPQTEEFNAHIGDGSRRGGGLW
jgi:hypothetical protein